jgi:MFS transporter, DHA2 family, multidrug resistance protein
MVALLLVAPALLPEYRDAGAGRLELTSVALSLAAILPVVYGIKQLAAGDADTPTVAIGAILTGVAIGVLFVRRQLRLTSPLLDLGLFANRSFSAALAAMLLAAAAMAGTTLLVSQYLQTVLGLSPARAGLWLAPTGLAIAAGSLLAPAIARRLRPAGAVAAGLVLGAVGFLLIAWVGSAGGLVVVAAANALVAFGGGPLFALGTGLVVGSVPPERSGSAASLSETSNEFGSTLGLAVLGSVGAAVYRSQMADAIPAGVPAEAARTAHDTLAGATATATARQLPAEAATELLHSARQAFTTGLNTAAVIGAIVFVALAVLAVTVLRHAGSTSGEAHQDNADPAAQPAG